MILLGNIPQELKQKKQWVGWHLINNRKVPMCASTFKAAQSSNPETWSTFDQAVEAYKQKRWSGIGFVFNKDYVGIDLDHCIDNGRINEFGNKVLSKLNSYTEYSPSGTGIHIIAKGDIPRALKTDKIEIYNTGRYFTVTGRLIQQRRLIRPVDVSHYYPVNQMPLSVKEKLEQMKPGNVDNTLTSLAGSLYKKGASGEEVFLFLKEKANQAGHDDTALKRICSSVKRYHPKGEYNGFARMERTQEEERKPIEVFTPASHIGTYKRKFYGEEPVSETVPTGFSTVDSFTDGYTKGSVWVVGARPGIGKTSFCVAAAFRLLEAGKRVVFFTTETTWKSVFNRFVSLGTGIDFRKIKSGQLDPGEQTILEQYLRKFESYRLFIIDKAQPRSGEVAEKISELRPDVFFFDHIHRVESRREQRRLDIGDFILALNNIARDNNCAGVIGAQLNRAADYELPRLSHLKECGQLEEEAHIVVLLSNVTAEGEIKRLDFAKHREGQLKVLEFKFEGNTAQFKESIDA